jgi:hypothetical protein
MKKIFIGLGTILYIVGAVGVLIVYAKDLTSAHYIVRDPVIDTGGGFQSSGSFRMYSAGNINTSGDGGTSASFKGREGFLQYPLAAASVLTGVVTGSSVAVSWSATNVANGYTISGYNLGVATVSGGPYTYTAVSNVLTYTYVNQLPNTYYYVLQTLDAFGNVIATSNEMTATVQEIVSFSISANSLSFGPLTSIGTRYATSSGGSSSNTSGNSLSASSNSSAGYTIAYNGSTLANGGNTITPATIAGSATGTTGANQFALSLLASGSASVPTSYDQSSLNWKFAQNTLTTIATTSGPTAVATLNAYYLANTATLAAAGTYSTTLTYDMTANY